MFGFGSNASANTVYYETIDLSEFKDVPVQIKVKGGVIDTVEAVNADGSLEKAIGSKRVSNHFVFNSYRQNVSDTFKVGIKAPSNDYTVDINTSMTKDDAFDYTDIMIEYGNHIQASAERIYHEKSYFDIHLVAGQKYLYKIENATSAFKLTGPHGTVFEYDDQDSTYASMHVSDIISVGESGTYTLSVEDFDYGGAFTFGFYQVFDDIADVPDLHAGFGRIAETIGAARYVVLNDNINHLVVNPEFKQYTLPEEVSLDTTTISRRDRSGYDNGFELVSPSAFDFRDLAEDNLLTGIPIGDNQSFATLFTWSPFNHGVTFDPRGYSYEQRTGSVTREESAQLAAEERASSLIGDPVDAFTGGFIDERELLSYGGTNPLSISLHYDSIVRGQGTISGGFTHSHETSLNIMDKGAELQWRPDSIVRFELVDGEYIPISESQAGLSLVGTDNGYILTKISGDKYAFNTIGQLVQHVDAVGLVANYNYSDGLLSSIENTKGQYFDFGYNGNGQLISIVDAGDRTINFEYGDDGVSKVIFATGDTMAINYVKVSNDDIKVQKLSMAGSVLVDNRYDKYGRVDRQFDGRGNLTEFNYDEHSNPDRVTTQMTIGNRVTTLVHDNSGQLLSKIDGEGFVESYEYDDRRNVVQYTNQNGDVFNREYDELNRLTQSINPDDSVRKLSYFENTDKLSNVVYEDNSESSFKYDDVGRISKVIDQLGHTTMYQYDTFGNVLSVWQGDRMIENTYDDQGYLSSTTRNGNTVEMTTNKLGLVISMTSEGNVIGHEYDDAGRRILTTNPDGGETAFQYNAFGDVIERIDADDVMTTMEYDDNGNLLSEVVDTRGHYYEYNIHNEISSEYDKSGRSSRNKMTYGYNKRGDQLSVEDNDGVASSWRYDGVGNIVTASLEDISSTYTYDYMGNVLSETDGNGGLVEYQYDALGRLLESESVEGKSVSYSYNAGGQRIESVDGLGNKTLYEYDEFGNVSSVESPNGAVTSYQYDDNDALLSETNALDETISRSYNGLGQLIYVKNDLNEIVFEYGYDDMGNITSITDGNGHTTKLSYDAMNRLVSTMDPLGNVVETNRYNDYGERIGVTDAVGAELEFKPDGFGNIQSEYDALGYETSYYHTDASRLLEATDPNYHMAAHEYDKYGNVTHMGEIYGRNVMYEYDHNQNVTREIFDRGGVSYDYNLDDELVTHTNGRGDSISYEYDANGNVVKEIADGVETEFSYDAVGNQLTAGNISRTYDDLGRVTSKTTGDDTIEYRYDGRGHLVEMTHPDGDSVLYEYDVMGNLLSVTDWNNKVTEYEYDANSRLVRTDNWNGTTESRDYDAAGQLVSIGRSDGSSETFEYDLNGNIIQENDDVYKYDTLNRLVKAKGQTYEYDNYGNITDVLGSRYDLFFRYGDDNELTRVNGLNTAIDKDGNLTKYTNSDGIKHNAVYDVKNLLVSYDGVEYDYDIENNRTSIDDVAFVVDNDSDRLSRVLVERSGDDVVKYVYGNGLIGAYRDGSFETHHYDLRGSTVSMSDESGDVFGRVSYDPYGEIVSKDDGVKSRFLYNGQYGVQTDDNGLYHMRARYYNSELKRFMNRDIVAGSIEESQTLNRYAYVNGDPVSYHDPFGLARELLTRDNIQLALDFAGIIPGWGAIADLTNAGIYAWNGEWSEAGKSAFSTIPGVGDIAGVAKISSRVVKTVDNVVDSGKVYSKSYKFWNMSAVFQNTKVYQRDDLFDPYKISSWSEKGNVTKGTNIDRMWSGRSPIGYDDEPINLHHLTQSNDSVLAEVSHSMHNRYDKVLHISDSNTPSKIDRGEFNKYRRDYWENRSLDYMDW